MHKASVVPRGESLGVTVQLPESEDHRYSNINTAIMVLVS